MALAFALRSEIEMVATTFKLDVSYSQIAVFVSTLQQPFNDWTDRHLAQGFSWRPGSVSFQTLAEFGVHIVEIFVTQHMSPVDVDVIRAIDVPFEVPDIGEIEVASISDAVPLSLPAGTYCLRCEFFGETSDSDQRVRFSFASDDAPRFAIVKLDSKLFPETELLTTAEAAVA